MNTKTRHIAGAGLGLLTILGNADAEIVGYEKYIHDAAGNLVEKQIDDQITRFDYEGNILKADSTGSAYRHDSAGRLVAASGARGVERELTYQFGDKITRVEKGGTATELLYNAEGQLVGRNSSGQTEVFAWDGLGLVMRGQESYANEIGIAGERPVLSNEDVVVSDYLGTTLNISGESFFGTAFGEGLRNAFFTGKPYVDSLEGYVFKWRNYMSDLGRWTTLDPLGYPDGAGPFSYTNGDPVNSFDELGLFGSYFIDPANNNMDPDQGWSMYNTFHTANNDNPLIGFHTPGNGHFQDSAGDIWEVRIKYEYVRKPNGTNLTIPANT
jgi:RHS repeat-associated protein